MCCAVVKGLIKSAEVKYKVDKMPQGLYQFYIFLPCLLIQPLSFEVGKQIYGLTSKD
jgi:hypothetical protein